MEKEPAKGFTCKECKREHVYPSYVHAHWDIVLTFKCECGARYTIYKGQAHKDHR